MFLTRRSAIGCSVLVTGSAFLVAVFLFVNRDPVQAAENKPYTTWTEYGGSLDSAQYSALKEIDKFTLPSWSRSGSTRPGIMAFVLVPTRS
jgi:hypothetical protein